MKFFALITLISAFLLSLSNPFAPDVPHNKKATLQLPERFHQKFKANFNSPQNANVLWAFVIGEKNGIAPRVLKDFNDLELGFLFSPSGIHLTGLIVFLFFFIKKIGRKKILKKLEWIILITLFFLPYLAIKRVIIFRLLVLINRKINLKISNEYIFIATFLISLTLGHYQQSPAGFILSFLYMGTFISLKDQSRPALLLGLFSSHLLICFFTGQEISPTALLLNLPLLGLFSLAFPFFILYFLSFQWIHYNWIEFIVRFIIVGVHWMAKIPQGTLLSSTLFLILAVWIILLRWPKKYLLVVLLLHGNVANSPSVYYQKSFPRVQQLSVHT